MRLATFNILHGRNPADGLVDLATYAAAIAALDVEVLALQEVDRNQPRSHGADLAALAAEAMDAREHRFLATMSGTPGAGWVASTGEEPPDAATYGIALLSRHPVSAWQLVRLPSLVRDEPRSAVAAIVQAPGGPVTVVCSHLSVVPWWNRRQLRSLVRSVASAPRPLVLMGDLNLSPRRVVSMTRMTPAVAAHTFPADSPREQRDHILLDGPLTTATAEARQLPLSDHRALVADVTPA